MCRHLSQWPPSKGKAGSGSSPIPAGESLPLEEENGPATDFERTGLQVMADDPSEIYAGTIKRGKLHYFKAIYADRVVSKACVECHNGHLLSPRLDYKLNDVMGGVIVSFPVK